MAKTVFTNQVTHVDAAFLNVVFGLDGHNHKGEDSDGSAPLISLEELDPQLLNLLNDLIALRPFVNMLFKGNNPRANLFGGLGKDGAFAGTNNLDLAEYEFTSFIISEGQTVRTTGGVTRIKVQGDLLINGLLLGQAANPYGIGKGWYNNGGSNYGIGASFQGSGGAEAVDHSDETGLSVIRDRGGLGGSSIIFEVLGSIVINGSIACPGSNGNLSQILTGAPNIGGSGGGSGGSVVLQSFTSIQVNGTVGVPGGDGANAQGSNVSGGGAGAGGWIYGLAPAINDLPNSYNVIGGRPGTTLGTGSRQGGGGGGFAGSGGNHKAAGSSGRIVRTVQPIFSYI